MTCKHCVEADAAVREACQGVLKALRAERAASRDPKTRNVKLRGIKQVQARLAQPVPSGPCTWRPVNGGTR